MTKEHPTGDDNHNRSTRRMQETSTTDFRQSQPSGPQVSPSLAFVTASLEARPMRAQHLEQDIGRLRARNAVAPDDEEGHAADARRSRLFLIGTHVGGMAITMKNRGDLVGVEAHFRRQPLEDGGIANGLALGEVGEKEAFFEGRLDGFACWRDAGVGARRRYCPVRMRSKRISIPSALAASVIR